MVSGFKGVNESVRAWSGMGHVFDAATRLELRDQGQEDRDKARKRLAGREGGFRERRHPGSIGSEVSGQKVVVFIERDGTSPAAEFGAKRHMVYGRSVSQSSMKRRTAAGFSQRGRMVGPEWEAAQVAKKAKRLADRGLKTISGQLNRYGVPR